jgi:hypothetical protein
MAHLLCGEVGIYGSLVGLSLKTAIYEPKHVVIDAYLLIVIT